MFPHDHVIDNIMAPTATPLMEGHTRGSENAVAFQGCSWRIEARDWGTKYQQLHFSYWYSFFSNKCSVNCCKPLVIFRVLKPLILTLATCSVLSWRSGCGEVHPLPFEAGLAEVLSAKGARAQLSCQAHQLPTAAGVLRFTISWWFSQPGRTSVNNLC